MWGKVEAMVGFWASNRAENWEELCLYIDGEVVVDILLVKDAAHKRDLNVTKSRAVVLGLAADRAAKAAVALAGRSIILDTDIG